MMRAGKVLVMVACVAYPFLLHLSILQQEAEGLALLLVLLPLLLWATWIATRTIARIWWPVLVAGVLALVYYMLVGQHMRIGLIAVDGIWHASLNLLLFWFFGRTVLPGREPLISQISRRLNNGLDPSIAAYTRHATIAWTLFFGVQLAGSALLYLFAPINAWSLFINVLNTPLVVLMFVVEYVVRTVLHPDHPRISILKTIQVFATDFAVPRKADR